MTSLPDSPIVSVVVPMLNERGNVESCLDSFAAQDHPLDRLEVILVDGGSTDGSREVVEARAEEADWIRIVENPDRRASSAFNRGFEAAKGDVVCLFSSHGVADETFVSRSVEALRQTGASGVGGVLRHEGLDPASRAIGLAMTSPAGMASPFRYADTPREVDTIGHPAYVAARVRDVGPFDETLERNADYEYNWRLRAAGHRLWFDPAIRTSYRPRGSLRTLARQFWWYGRWKERVVRRHPRSLRARHLVAPAAVVGVLLGPILVRSRWGRRLFASGVSGYAALVVGATVASHPRAHDADPLVTLACFPVMHASWGAGFLLSVAEDTIRPGGSTG